MMNVAPWASFSSLTVFWYFSAFLGVIVELEALIGLVGELGSVMKMASAQCCKT
jgi:hypothetical protein